MPHSIKILENMDSNDVQLTVKFQCIFRGEIRTACHVLFDWSQNIL